MAVDARHAVINFFVGYAFAYFHLLHLFQRSRD
jgi:hypothetical protein